MSSETVIEIRPAAASQSGKNAFTHWCPVVEQHMHYCGCLNRINVLKDKTAFKPADWRPCDSAISLRRCKAADMREQETLQDKAIYYVERGLEAIAKAVKTWVMPEKSKKDAPAPKEVKVFASGKGGSMLDGLAAATKVTYADAINKMAKTEAPAPGPKATLPAGFKAMPGETPLQTALRLKALRTKEST